MLGKSAFTKWFGASKVREDEKTPLVVYHGTTHDFAEFTLERVNIENFWGVGFYFSSSPYDAGANYAGEGADLTGRIEQTAERLEDELGRDAALAEARKRLKGSHEGAILPVYLKMTKPLVLGTQRGGSYVQSLAETRWSPEKSSKFADLVLMHATEFQETRDSFEGDLMSFIWDEEHAAEDVIMMAQEDEAITYATDDDGNYARKEILARALRDMGYDGIIDRKVAKRFPGMQLSWDDAHFIVWNPTQVKSVFNKGKWSPKDPVIVNGEKARVTTCGGRRVSYGAKGAKVMPGTPKGDAYCARSAGQMRDHPEAAADPCSPLRLSRKRWACKGERSMKTNPAEDHAALPAPIINVAPNPTPFGDVVIEPDVKPNAVKRESLAALADVVREIEGASLAAGSEPVGRIVEALKKFKGDELGPQWTRGREKMIAWLSAGMPVPSSDSLGAANKITTSLNGEKATCFSIFAQGNSKLPYLAFSTLPGVTCPGAGECLVAAGRRHDPNRRLNGGWCYSFKAWRYPDAFFRQMGNTLLLRSEHGKAHIARVFALWAETDARIPGGETVRLYVDGDIDSVETLKFWMDRCKAHPHVRAYGYSKSWHLFLRYEKLGYGWPSNYVMNLSEGSRFAAMPAMRADMLKLSVVREDFGVVAMPRKIPQNVIRIGRDDPNGVWGAIRRLEKRVKSAPKSEKPVLRAILAGWIDTAKRIEKKDETIKSVPDEFWSRNPEYTAAVTVEAEKKHGPGGFFVCPGKCGNCLGNGKHACGEPRLKKPIVIGIH